MFLVFIIVGLLAGFLAGLLGIGGGLLVVPTLFFLLSGNPDTAAFAMHVALGSSLAFIVFNSGVAAWTHFRLGGLRGRELAWLAPGLVAGSLLGAWIADQLPTDILQRWFGGFLVFMSVYLFLQRKIVQSEARHHWQSMVVAMPIGVIASLTGVGGGVMVVPWLMSRGYRPAVAVATSSASTVIVAVVGAFGYFLLASETPLPWSSGYVYWPAVAAFAMTAMVTAPYGARLAHRIDQRKLKQGFAVLLMIVGVKLLAS